MFFQPTLNVQLIDSNVRLISTNISTNFITECQDSSVSSHSGFYPVTSSETILPTPLANSTFYANIPSNVFYSGSTDRVIRQRAGHNVHRDSTSQQDSEAISQAIIALERAAVHFPNSFGDTTGRFLELVETLSSLFREVLLSLESAAKFFAVLPRVLPMLSRNINTLQPVSSTLHYRGVFFLG